METGSTSTAKHVLVTGRVQGVSFRAWTQKQAQAAGVSGWVRNRADGSVEAVLSGPSDAVEALIAALHHGPPAAKVVDVQVTKAVVPQGTGFRIAR
jgi:acylphosphatase